MTPVDREDTIAALRRIAVLLTVHDRKAHTLECLAHLRRQHVPNGVSTSVFMVDDGCSDGTVGAVRRVFPEVCVIQGTGQLYWNGGMRLALATALRDDPDFFLLLNDDTNLDENALATVLATHDALRARGAANPLVVGATRDPGTGVPTYGGQARTHPIAPRFALIGPVSEPIPCDTVNGNCLLISREVVRRVGNLSSEFTHAYGDIDYGLRAVQAGCSCWVAPGFVGHCERNPNTGSFVDERQPIMVRWRKMLGPKGVPFAEWRALTSRHCGSLWRVYWLGTYAKFWVLAPLRALRRQIFGPRAIARSDS